MRLRVLILTTTLTVGAGCTLLSGIADLAVREDGSGTGDTPGAGDAGSSGTGGRGVADGSSANGGGPSDAMPPDIALGWTKKRRLTIDASWSTTTLTNTPVMISLDGSRISYASAKPDGSDLRFTDATGKVLPYEIETWNPNGTSLLWVAVPSIPEGATTDLWLFYGNPDAPPGQARALVWDADYVGVWHLSDERDSTEKHQSTNVGATPASRGPSPAMSFDEGKRIDTGAAEVLPTYTIEAWFRARAEPVTGQDSRYVLAAEGDGYSLQWDCNNPQLCRRSVVKATSGWTSARFGDVGAGTWHHVVATYDGATLRTYVNGAFVDSTSFSNPTAPKGSAWIGGHRQASWPVASFLGEIDEVRVSSKARPQAYAELQFRSTTDALVTYGAETDNPSLTLTP